MLTVGSLFSGIGGFDLGLERAGMRVIWQSEIDPYASAVLRKHWPNVVNIGDINDVDTAYVEIPDVVCGGFPCQPFSSASRGRRTGTADDRYLWPQMRRVIENLRPSWVIGENVAHLNGVVLANLEADLVALGYRTAILEIPACAVGHDHRRRRNWILGHTDRGGKPKLPFHAEVAGMPGFGYVAGRMGKEDGIPNRMDRLRCLGNSIVPQIAEIIGRAIIEAERA
jgi:DNA (cytosine-5)-methyltransferase 1